MLERLKRRTLLGLLRRQTAQSLLLRGRAALPGVLRSAARRSEAYSELLREHGVSRESLAGEDCLALAPVLDKQQTFERFHIRQLLANDVPPASLASVLTSSGYGAKSFGFGISDRREQAATPGAIDLGLQNAFGVDDRRTLLINTLPMGVVFESRAACVSNVSVREDMALAILRQAGPLFDQVILVVDPLFCKRFLDYADAQQFDFRSQRVHMIIGEETFQEPFRDYLADRLGADLQRSDAPFLGSSMGVGELGLNLFFETPETVALRRALQAIDPWRRQPMIFCFNPLRSWAEVHDPDADGVGSLLLTMMSKSITVPLPRYSTGDRVSWLSEAQLSRVPRTIRESIESLPFPILALHGRDRDQLAPHWHVDDFKALQYRDPELARGLSGAFRVSRGQGRLLWELQGAAASGLADSFLKEGLEKLVAARLQSLGQTDASPVDVELYPFPQFPHGQNLDYERKFRYVGEGS